MDCCNNILELLTQSYDECKPPEDYFNKECLDALVSNESIDIRIWLAKALVYGKNCEYAVEMLHELSQDKDASVRVEAIDSLSNFVCRTSFEVFCNTINDQNTLVRAYSAFGVALVGMHVSRPEALSILHRIAETERNRRVLVDIYEGLYILGDVEKLNKLLELFYSSDYHIQCAVLHALIEILSCENLGEIRKFIDSLDPSIHELAVNDTIQQLKTSIQLQETNLT